MVTIESLQQQIDMLTEQQNDAMRLIYQLMARSAMESPEKRMMVGVANRVALEKMELGDKYDAEIFYKNSRMQVVKSQLSIEEEDDITGARFLCWHLLMELGKITQRELEVEYGFTSFFKHTHKKIQGMKETTSGRALVLGAESRFREEFERCLYDADE